MTRFVEEYVGARGSSARCRPRSPTSARCGADEGLTAYERTAMLVHVASRAATRASHRRVLPLLRDTLAEELGIGG